MNILEVKNVSKKYGNLEIIKDVSLNVKEGETLVILGPSGSGKSTLLRCINNLEKINSGNIIINGEKMIKEYKKSKPIYNNKEILKKINLYTGMIFQDFNLFPHLSVKENIMVSQTKVLKKDKNEAEKVADELLEKMDLLSRANSYPCNLSGGQKQRVSIARCLAINPQIICMDEPTSALDPELIGEVLKVIKDLSKEKRTMIIVTHEIKFAEEVADRVIFMDQGKIIEEGSSYDVIRNPKKQRTKDFLKRYIDVKERKMEKLNINEVEPKEVLKFFEEISRVPRKSGNEEKIKEYLVEFAKKRKLEVYEDENYNVIIKKEASSGYENNEVIALQAHTDMVCEKREDIKHDFEKDPIILYKEDDYIKANGTTLGADNGIGVAQILAILDSKVKMPKVEAIFTVQEETTMIGAINIDLSKLESKKIISLDGGREGKILVGSANCLEWKGRIKKEYIGIPENYSEYELKYNNFKGGHSGGNIGDIKRGNPIKLGISILKQIKDVYIKEICGGSQVNVIPRDFSVKFFTKSEKIKIIEKMINEQKEFYENVSIEIIKCNEDKMCFSKDITNRVIDFIYNYENGALEYINNNVILSCNMAEVKEDDLYINIGYSTRANDLKLRDKYLERLEKLVKTNDLEIYWNQELKGVEQDINNSLILKCNEVYKNLYKKDLERIITQGVVEGGFFKDKIKDLQYVCIGPNTEDVHSPNERVSITSLQNTYRFLQELLSVF